MNEKPIVVCITPIKNEAWILEYFLSATSLWADHIIIADQGSTDASREIAARFPKVRLLHNPGQYNEYDRTRLMLKEARNIPGHKLIMALDADEFLSADFMVSEEWQHVLQSPTNTIIQIERLNIGQAFRKYFSGINMVFGLMDDGKATMESTSQANIHNIRLPWPKDATVLKLEEVKVLHFDTIDYRRVISKGQWYQVFERTVNKKDVSSLLRKYNFYDTEAEFLSTQDLRDAREDWFRGYDERGIRLRNIVFNPDTYWWDAEVLDFFDKNGIENYKLLNVWGKDWEAEATRRGLSNPARFRKSLNALDKWVLRYWKTNIRKRSQGMPLVNSILYRLGYK